MALRVPAAFDSQFSSTTNFSTSPDLVTRSIDRVTFKNAMVPCGHTACRECLGIWLGRGKGCCWCRRRYEEGDIRDIYLGSSNEIRNTLEDDDSETDVISLASDSRVASEEPQHNSGARKTAKERIRRHKIITLMRVTEMK